MLPSDVPDVPVALAPAPPRPTLTPPRLARPVVPERPPGTPPGPSGEVPTVTLEATERTPPSSAVAPSALVPPPRRATAARGLPGSTLTAAWAPRTSAWAPPASRSANCTRTGVWVGRGVVGTVTTSARIGWIGLSMRLSFRSPSDHRGRSCSESVTPSDLCATDQVLARGRAHVVEDDGVAREGQRDLERCGRFEVEQRPRLALGDAVASNDNGLEGERLLTRSDDDGADTVARRRERDGRRPAGACEREDRRGAPDVPFAVEHREHRGSGSLEARRGVFDPREDGAIASRRQLGRARMGRAREDADLVAGAPGVGGPERRCVNVREPLARALAGIAPREPGHVAMNSERDVAGVARGVGDSFVARDAGELTVDLCRIDLAVAVAGVDPGDEPAVSCPGHRDAAH